MPPRIRVEGPRGTARAEDLIAAGGPHGEQWRSQWAARREAGLRTGLPVYTRAVSSGAGRVSEALRLAGTVAVLAVFLIAHGVQCAATSPSVHGGTTDAHVMVTGMPDGVSTTDAAAGSAGPQPAGPAHTVGHAVAVCFAVIAAVMVLLLGRRSNSSVPALARHAQRRIAAVCTTAERWRANAPPLSVLCVART